eukprot:6470746-Amphidinium_carterae.2
MDQQRHQQQRQQQHDRTQRQSSLPPRGLATGVNTVMQQQPQKQQTQERTLQPPSYPPTLSTATHAASHARKHNNEHCPPIQLNKNAHSKTSKPSTYLPTALNTILITLKDGTQLKLACSQTHTGSWQWKYSSGTSRCTKTGPQSKGTQSETTSERLRVKSVTALPSLPITQLLSITCQRHIPKCCQHTLKWLHDASQDDMSGPHVRRWSLRFFFALAPRLLWPAPQRQPGAKSLTPHSRPNIVKHRLSLLHK